MEILERNGLRILQAQERHYITTADKNQVFEGVIYLGISDTLENYTEITQEERDTILSQQETE